jgi:hypothetical protein
MKYVAACKFRDLKDNGRIYEKGDTYPRRGLKKDEARIKELSTNANKSGKPLIVAAD